MTFVTAIEFVTRCLEGAGVAVILIGALVAAAFAVHSMISRRPAYNRFREQLGRSILIGLELLVAGDICRTVAVTPSLENVLNLAIIVLVRTFLSFSLEVEITGRWPWQKRAGTGLRTELNGGSL
jgi:uncharacterized membrane protein